MGEPALEEGLGSPLLGASEGVATPDDAAAAAPQGAGLRGTCFNICNIYIGLGLLTMPYALEKGGWAALAALVAMVLLFGVSGQLICRAFDLMPPGVPRSYPELGRTAAGTAGARAVLLFCFMELAGASIVLLMVAWQMLELLLPSEGIGRLRPLPLAAALSTLALLPLLFIELRQLSRLSMLGAASTTLVIAMVLALLGLDPQRAAMPLQPPPGRHLVSAGIIQAVGIFALSCSAHTTLPALRSAMRKPAQFPAALAISFAAMLACYASLAAAGYWYWGDSASPLVTTDLAINSYYSARRMPIDRALAVFVLINCLTKYPGLNLILQDMLLSALPAARGTGSALHPPRPWVVCCLRVALYAACAGAALTAYQRLGAVLSLLGGLCSITCSLVLPSAFYARLAWHRLGRAAKAALLCMLCLALCMALLVTGINVCELLPACHGWMHPMHEG